MAEKPEPDDPRNFLEMALRVSERVQIRSVLLVEAHLMRGTDERIKRGGLAPVHNNGPVSVERVPEPPGLSVRLGFDFQLKREGEPGEEPLFLVAAEFVLTYSVSSLEGIEDTDLFAFAATNGVFNAWPYWREYLQSASVRMGIPPITIPVYRLPTVSPAKEPAEEKPRPDQEAVAQAD